MVTLAEPFYRVHLTVGPYSWTIERGDPADYGPVDGLKMGWKYPDNAAWPTQYEVPWCTFGVIVADKADFQGVTEGAHVQVAVYHVPAGTPLPEGWQDGDLEGSWLPVASFAGRVTQLDAKPHGLGMLYQVAAMDYLVDLAEARLAATGAAEWPAGYIRDRLTLIADELPDVFGSVPFGEFEGPEELWGVFHANPADELKSALDWYTEFLSQYVKYGHQDTPLQGGAREYVTPNNTLGLYSMDTDPQALVPDPARRYNVGDRFKKNFNRGMPSRLPCRFRPTGAGGKWRPDADPDDGVVWLDWLWEEDGTEIPAEGLGVLPAGVIEFDASWSRTKKGRAERVYVQTSVVFVDAPSAKRAARSIRQDPYYADFSSDPPPSLTVDTTLGYRSEAFDLADFLLPEPDQATRWEVQRFRLLADLVPDRLNRANSQTWFHPVSFVGTPLRCIHGIPPEQNPNAGTADWYAGILTSAEFTIQDGRYWVDFTLSRELPRPATSTDLDNTGYLSCGSLKLDPTLAAVTVAQVDPGYSTYDYRACRRGPT